MNYLLHLAVIFEIYLVVAASLNLLIGYAGLLQAAHAAYFGVGAYTATIVMQRCGLPFIPALLCSGLTAAALSLLVSLPALRFRGDAFVLMSLAVQIGLFAVFYNWVSLTGGPYGLSGIPKPSIGSTVFATANTIMPLYAFIAIVSVSALAVLKHHHFGRMLQALRDDELAAISLGIPVGRLKVLAFAISAGLVGVAGCMYAAYATYIDPSSFTLDESLLMLSMVIVGGTGNVRGPLVGALVLIALPELLRLAPLPDSMTGSLRLLLYGLLLVLFMRLRPQGLAGRYRFE